MTDIFAKQTKIHQVRPDPTIYKADTSLRRTARAGPKGCPLQRELAVVRYFNTGFMIGLMETIDDYIESPVLAKIKIAAKYMYK